MAPGNNDRTNDRQPNHTGTIPKTKVRNNSNVPQEAVTPTRRDMTSNLGTTSLDWVPVSEYNSRNTNYNQSRKPTNNLSDHDLADLDNSISYESGFGRFVPVRPQPRALPLNSQNHDNITVDHNEDAGVTSMTNHSLHPYAHQLQNGLIPHTNHAPAAVMIVNPTTPSCTGNISLPFNAPNQNRNNLTRNFNSARNNLDGNSHVTNNNTPSVSNSRSGAKTVNMINNMYEQVQGSYSNINESDNMHRDSARALGEAIVAACPDAAAVERRLGQIREYIRVTSSLVDTMRNSEDETQQDVVVRPVSAQSNGSAYSENELWQNEIKNKMELSQLRLSALKQQQKRLLKYQEEAKQQLEEMNREKQSREMQPSTSHDNLNQSFGGNYQNSNRMYAANQIGVATTLPQSGEGGHGHGSQMSNNIGDGGHSAHSSQDDRFSHRETNIGSGEEAPGAGPVSDGEEDESVLSDHGRMLQLKLRELQLKKQHMENLVSEFQKLQMATSLGTSHNTYSSSGDDSGDEEPSRKCNKSGGNIKNEDPFKLMEIKAIKAALQKTKDLMRSVENYETDHLSSIPDDAYQVPRHSNIHDNKSEGGGSLGGWSNEGSVCRVRNTLPQRPKFTNEQHSQQHQQQQHHQQQQQQQQQLSHEANLASLQELAQKLRKETEEIMSERARVKDMASNKEVSRKQKVVNEEVRAGPSGASSTEGSSSRPGPSTVRSNSNAGSSLPNGAVGPVERRQMQLRALLADKQMELEALLNKRKMICAGGEPRKIKPDSLTASLANQSYNSEQEEPDSQSELLADSQNMTENDNFRGGGDDGLVGRSNAMPSHLGSAYGSDSDSGTRSNRNRSRRRPTQDRVADENNVTQVTNNNTNQNIPARVEPPPNINLVPPISQNNENPGVAYPHVPPSCWTNTKSNQDVRSNQFTQNSQSQTMERLLGTPQMSYPPSMPFNMMMPYGMVGGCGCGCGFWGAWCWQQLVMQQREIHQLRDQLNHLEERWRVETASHTLNNQVPPGNRANNYWDNFRSYSRQNLLSANSKTNADGHLGVGPTHNPHPLVERSHNTLHHSSSTPPSNTPKRNLNMASGSSTSIAQPMQTNNDELLNSRVSRRNVAYERSLSFSSAPDVLNIQKSEDSASQSNTRNVEESIPSVSNVNIKRQESSSNPLRNLNITNPIPEIIQSHSNNLNTPTNSKKKSSSKLPAKNSSARRNSALGYSQTSNVNIASTSETPNPNLASTSRDVHDKATSKLFDLLRENVYSEVTALIGVNESHPDFLIQLFRELQLISSDPLRQKVLQSIRNVLSQYGSITENHNVPEESRMEASIEMNNYHDCNSLSSQNVCTNSMQIDNSIVHFLLQRCEEIFTPELLESLTSHILNNVSIDTRQGQLLKKKLIELLSKYEGMRVCDISSDIIENLALFVNTNNEADESTQLTSEMSESSILQDVAGSLNLFSSSDTQLHQLNSCPYDMWQSHVHMEIDANDMNDNSSPRSSQEGKVDLINCSEMHNGDLAEADQTCRTEASGEAAGGAGATGGETLPDVVDTDEATPTEAEAEWLGLDRVPTRLHMEEASEKQKDQ